MGWLATTTGTYLPPPFRWLAPLFGTIIAI